METPVHHSPHVGEAVKRERTYSPYTGLALVLAFGTLVIAGGAFLSFLVIKSLIIVWSYF